ncbi:MAG: hypothetical protein BHV77_08895 [Bacteroides sp. 43_108]|nr:MAG: hypothetical protein BHV77_08895 [Bacteroides sp. 43_108]
MIIRFLVLARNDDMVVLMIVLFIQTEEQKNIRMQMMPVCLCLHKQAPAFTSNSLSCQNICSASTAFLKNRRAGYTSIKQQHSTLNSVIPGQDQVSYLNVSTMPAIV